MAMNLSELHSYNSTMLGHDVDHTIHLGPELKAFPTLDVYRDADMSWYNLNLFSAPNVHFCI